MKDLKVYPYINILEDKKYVIGTLPFSSLKNSKARKIHQLKIAYEKAKAKNEITTIK